MSQPSEIRTYIAVLKNSFYRRARSKSSDKHSLRQKFLMNVLNEHLKNNLYVLDGEEMDYHKLVKQFVKDNYPKLSFHEKKTNTIKPFPRNQKSKDKLLSMDTDVLLENVIFNDEILENNLQYVLKKSLAKYCRKLENRRKNEIEERTRVPDNYKKLLDEAEYARISMKRYKTDSKEEKEFWDDLASKYAKLNITDKKKWYEETLQKFEQITTDFSNGKTTAYKAKKSRIEQMSEAINLQPFNKKGWGFGIQDLEIVFKVPDQWKIKADAQNFLSFAKDFQKRNFENYDTLFIAIHCDENPDNPHCHLKMSGKNNKTGNYDISNQIYQMIQDRDPELYKSIVPSNTVLNNKLTKEQRIKLWEEWQTIVLKEFENHLNKELEQKVVIKKDPERSVKRKSIQESNDRIHNAQNKALEELAKTNIEIDNKIKSFPIILNDILDCQKNIFKSINRMFKMITKHVINRDFDKIFDYKQYNNEVVDINSNIDIVQTIINNEENKYTDKEKESFKEAFYPAIEEMVGDLDDIIKEYEEDFDESLIENTEQIKTRIADATFDISNNFDFEENFEEDFEENFDIETPKEKRIYKPTRSPRI